MFHAHAFHFSVPLYLQRFQRHHVNAALELPDRVLHTPVVAILCLNLIPLLMISNQPTTDHSMDSFDPDSSSHIVPFDFLVDLRGNCFIQHRPALPFSVRLFRLQLRRPINVFSILL